MIPWEAFERTCLRALPDSKFRVNRIPALSLSPFLSIMLTPRFAYLDRRSRVSAAECICDTSTGATVVLFDQDKPMFFDPIKEHHQELAPFLMPYCVDLENGLWTIQHGDSERRLLLMETSYRRLPVVSAQTLETVQKIGDTIDAYAATVELSSSITMCQSCTQRRSGHLFGHVIRNEASQSLLNDLLGESSWPSQEARLALAEKMKELIVPNMIDLDPGLYNRTNSRWS